VGRSHRKAASPFARWMLEALATDLLDQWRVLQNAEEICFLIGVLCAGCVPDENNSLANFARSIFASKPSSPAHSPHTGQVAELRDSQRSSLG
jgi:hypothetical protein